MDLSVYDRYIDRDDDLPPDLTRDLVDSYRVLQREVSVLKGSETVYSVTRWANITFGDSTPEDSLARAFKEIRELFWLWVWGWLGVKPFNHVLLVREAADVCITLYRYIGIVDALAIERKMAVNRARRWKLSGDGTGQHIE